MCGICGIYYTQTRPDRLSCQNKVGQMLATIKHRGPDDSQVYTKGPLCMGTTRLSIIDRSVLGRQPMTIDNGAYVISFNGEIYNYLELRQELEQKGVRFRSGSDTEVLLRLYIQDGIECLQKLRGMFAFAIWQQKTKTLFVARDRVGEKPLVYYFENHLFAFGSEIKALLALEEVPCQINPLGLHYGLHYVNIPAPYSAFKKINKVRPAEYLLISPHGIKKNIYWKPRYNRADLISDPKEACFEINHCLDDTVKIMARSDVPLGVSLSGGLDSSAVVAALSKAKSSFNTFCISHTFNRPDPEFTAARKVAAQYRTHHHELVFKSDQIAHVPEIITDFDEPLASFVPLHAKALAGFIKKNVTVALSGNGGDELFGGYADQAYLMGLEKKIKLWKTLNKWAVGHLAAFCPIRGIRNSWKKYRKIGSIPLNRLAAELRLQQAQLFCSQVYSKNMKSMVEKSNPQKLYIGAFDDYQSPSLFDGLLWQQLMVGSRHSIVIIPDITGMAHSLEYRAPFLDVKMIELALRIPAELKINRAQGSAGGKMILRKALSDRLPAEIISMQKAGFGSAIPYHQWMIKEWVEYVIQRLTSPVFIESNLFDTQKLLMLFQLACSGKPCPMEMLWGVVMISEWLEKFF